MIVSPFCSQSPRGIRSDILSASTPITFNILLCLCLFLIQQVDYFFVYQKCCMFSPFSYLFACIILVFISLLAFLVLSNITPIYFHLLLLIKVWLMLIGCSNSYSSQLGKLSKTLVRSKFTATFSSIIYFQQNTLLVNHLLPLKPL